MKVQNLYGMKIDEFIKKFKIKNILCVIYLLITVILNVVLTLCRNEFNHNPMLVINIVIDVSCFFILLSYIGYYYLPNKHMLKLYKENKIEVEGEVREISAETSRYMKLDCFVVTIDEHKYYVPENKFIKFSVGKKVKISTAYEVVLEVFTDEN